MSDSINSSEDYFKILISAFTTNTEVFPDNLYRNASCLKPIFEANKGKVHTSTSSIRIPAASLDTLISVFLENTILLNAVLNERSGNNQDDT